MYEIPKDSTARGLVFLMIDSTDHITGKTGLSPTVTIRKSNSGSAGSWGTPAGTVRELASGWYQVDGNATDSNTAGPLLLHASASGADPCDAEYLVTANIDQTGDSYARVNLSLPAYAPGGADGLPLLSHIGSFASETPNTYTLGSLLEYISPSVGYRLNSYVTGIANNVITAASINASAMNGKGDWPVGKTGYFLDPTATIVINTTTGWGGTPLYLSDADFTATATKANVPTYGDVLSLTGLRPLSSTNGMFDGYRIRYVDPISGATETTVTASHWYMGLWFLNVETLPSALSSAPCGMYQPLATAVGQTSILNAVAGVKTPKQIISENTVIRSES